MNATSASRAEPGQLSLADLRLDRAAVLLACACVGLGWLNLLLVKVGWFTRHRSPSRLIDFNEGTSVVAWGEMVILLLAALAALVVARATLARGAGWSWWLIGLVLLAMSMNETMGIQQRAMRLILRMDLPFDVPGPPGLAAALVAVPFVAVAALLAVPILSSLPRPTRRGLAVGAAVYLAGALGVSAAAGAIDTGYNRETMLYLVVTGVEETLEYIGAAILFVAVLRHMAERTPVTIYVDRERDEPGRAA